MVIERKRDISLGRTVYTSDGERLGTVKDLRLDGFKVGALMQPEYWIPVSCVQSAGGNSLKLSFEKGELDRFKLLEPRRQVPRPAGVVTFRT